MHACTVLQRILRPVTARLDARNARNLFSAVEALLAGRRLTLMELARHFPGATRVRAPLKRFDRLLGNGDVQALRTRFYGAAMRWVVCAPRPVLVVDWSEIKTDGAWHLLRVGLVARGRTLTLYEEVHPEAHKNSPAVKAAFLQRLKALLPEGIRPALITDAGFRVPWFRTVEAIGWHWIGRVRHRARVRPIGAQEDRAWIPGKSLHARARTRPMALGDFEPTESKRLPVRLTLVRRAKRGRVERVRHGGRARGGHATKMARRGREPWLLACSRSLKGLSAGDIVRLYARRMQIEQSFRDLKSHRYGCAFEDTLTRDPRRLEMLLLIHLLASLAAWLAGLAAVTNALVQAHTPSRNARYSLLWIGWACLRRGSIRLSGPPAPAFARLRGLLAQPA